MCATSCARTAATCDSLRALLSTPRLIQTGPPGSENALISGRSATAKAVGILRSRRGANEPLSDVAHVARDRRVTELGHLHPHLLVGGPADLDLLLDGDQSLADARRTRRTDEDARRTEHGTQEPTTGAETRSCPRRRRRRHLLGSMPPQSCIGGRELDAVHQDHGGDIDPQQKDHDRRDRSVDHGQSLVVARYQENPESAARHSNPVRIAPTQTSRKRVRAFGTK